MWKHMTLYTVTLSKTAGCHLKSTPYCFSESWQWMICDLLTTTACVCKLTASLIIAFWIQNQFSYRLSSCMSIQFWHTLEVGVKRVHTNDSHCTFLSSDTVACFPADRVRTSLKLNKDCKKQTYKLCSI